MLSKFFNTDFLKKIEGNEITILICFGVIYRILFCLFYFHVSIFSDSEGYLYLSGKILNLDLTNYNGQRSFGYPLLISLAFGSTIVTMIYQFVIGIFTSLYWFKTLKKLKFSTLLSLYFTISLQCFINIHFYETAILVESFSLFFISILAYLLSDNYLENRSFKTDFLMAFIISFLVAIKPFYIFIPFLLYGLIILKNSRAKKIILKKVILLILPLMIFFGWSYVNKINTGYFVSSTFFGINLSQNCVYFAEKAPKEFSSISRPYVIAREKAIKEGKDVSMSIWFAYESGTFESYKNLSDFSNQMGKFAKATIEKNPASYLKQVALRSWFDFWKPSIYWNYDDFNFKYANKLFLLIWYLQFPLTLFFKFSFVLLFPFLCYNDYEKKEISIELIFSLLVLSASVLQAFATYGTNNRFSFPFEFLMIIVVLQFLKNNDYFSRPPRIFRQS